MEIWPADITLDSVFEDWAPERPSGQCHLGLGPGCRSEPQMEFWSSDGDLRIGMCSALQVKVWIRSLTLESWNDCLNY